MARQRRFTSSSRSARLTQWIGPPDQAYVNVAGGGATLVSSSTFEEPITLIRNRGVFSVAPQSPAADLEFVGAIGIGIVSAEAVAIGITAIPTPFTDADWGGWMVWRSFAGVWDVSSDIGRAISSWTLEIDSKAMRKISPNEAGVLVVESQSGAIQVADGVRQLIKLS